MAPKLYMFETSPPARAVLLAAKAAGIELDVPAIDVAFRSSPEFLKLNPTHTVPTLDDNGFVVFDSHAIATYLVEKYGKDDSLYPKDIKKRAIVNQMLHLDNGILHARIGQAVKPIFHGTATTIEKDNLDAIVEAYGFLETFLSKTKWLAGDSVTVADTSIICTVTTMNLLHAIDEKTHPKLAQWIKNCEASSWYSPNIKGLETLKQLIQTKLK